MSNSCHMQYGHALRWAWGCLMRSSLILGERGREGGREAEGEERQKEREKEQSREERSKSQTKQQWLTLGKCISLFNLATIYFQSSYSIFFFLEVLVCVCVLVMGSEQKTFLALLDSQCSFLTSSC